MPKRARASSVRPAPTRPARPRISPARRSRSTVAAGIGRGAHALDGNATRRRGRFAGRHVGDLEIAADHQLDHRVVGDRVAFERARPALPSRSTMTRSEASHHLVQAVRDEDDGDALRLEAGDDLEQLVGLGDRQARGRLVEDDEARAGDSAPWRSRPSAAGRATAATPASPARTSRRAGRDRAARSCCSLSLSTSCRKPYFRGSRPI